MADRANQHFVPQFFFKMFNGNRRYIHVLMRTNGAVHLNAPIKGQCARHNFYGSQEIESFFSTLEGRSAKAFRHVVDFAWNPERILDDTTVFDLLPAVLFQRARTEHEIRKLAPANEDFAANLFRKYVEFSDDLPNRDELLNSLDDLDFAINPQFLVLQSVSIALESAPLISDLRQIVLRNKTAEPFIFGDAPVVFVNPYCRKIKSRGVLGLQSAGLQIVLPLNPTTAMMFVDSDVYDGAYLNSTRVDVTHTSDVSQLNALQLHHSSQAVYFTNADESAYVHALWTKHRGKLTDIKSNLKIRRGWRVDGEPIDELYHLFDPQIPHRFDPSFILCRPIEATRFRFRHRSPELVRIHEAHIEKHQKRRDRAFAKRKT